VSHEFELHRYATLQGVNRSPIWGKFLFNDIMEIANWQGITNLITITDTNTRYNENYNKTKVK